jgi:ubiquinone/menaquinone biosynthesis C-methylase UbiE
MKLPYLSSPFSQKIGLDCSFFLTEDDYPSQRLLKTGLNQFHELAEMAKAGVYNIETVLLVNSDKVVFNSDKAVFNSGKVVFNSDKTVSNLNKTVSNSDKAVFNSDKAVFNSDKTVSDFDIDAKSFPSSYVLGFVLIERQQKTAECLMFTPVVSDAETKKAFQNIFNEWIDSVPSSCSIHRVFISDADLSSDVTAYYANTFLDFFRKSRSLFPSYESVYSVKRVTKAAETLQKTADLLNQKDIFSFLSPNAALLEICCGNGMSTLALHEKKMSPLCIDINAEELSIGLIHHVLKPEKTIHMDAATLSQNLDCETFDAVIGFMIGTIYEFNKTLWFSIADEAVKLLKKGGILLLTLRTENEGVWISNHLSKKGLCGQLIDNRDKQTDYDQWLYFAQK